MNITHDTHHTTISEEESNPPQTRNDRRNLDCLQQQQQRLPEITKNVLHRKRPTLMRTREQQQH
jgi:hypothetical protein